MLCLYLCDCICICPPTCQINKGYYCASNYGYNLKYTISRFIESCFCLIPTSLFFNSIFQIVCYITHTNRVFARYFYSFSFGSFTVYLTLLYVKVRVARSVLVVVCTSEIYVHGLCYKWSFNVSFVVL